jgi:F420-dependent oxidoreductase-like protein
VRFGAAFWINRTTWPDLRDTAVAVERAGWDALYVDDHLLADEGDWTDGKLEGWTTLAALATQTTRVRLGLLVAANGFRSPGLTAKLATTLDHLSGGRLILGLGGGWFEREHDAFGLDFGSGFGERLDRLDEAVRLIRRLLDGERVHHHAGRFYRLDDAVCEPRPIQDRLPILIGGSGPTKTLRTTARDADLWNAYGDPERIAEASEVLRERCAEIGRPFEAIDRTVTLHVVVRDTVVAARTAWDAIAARHGLVGRVAADGTGRRLSVGGPPDIVAAYLDDYRRIGVAEVILVFRDPFDHETIERLDEVRAALETIPRASHEPDPARPSGTLEGRTWRDTDAR